MAASSAIAFLAVNLHSTRKQLIKTKRRLTLLAQCRSRDVGECVKMSVDIMNAAAASGSNGHTLYKHIRRYFSQGDSEWNFADGSMAMANACHGGFAAYLTEEYPSLTVSDVRMCCLIVIGATPACISLACGYEHPVTFYNRRTRIRKKMNLETMESFEDHLSRLAKFTADRHLVDLKD